MKQGRALLGALLLALLPGCLGEQTGASSSWVQRLKPFQGVTGPNAVYMDVALLQLPCADAALYRDLWTFIDEGDQIVPLEKKAALENNGFRAGQVGLHPPAELLELLTDKRTCPSPRRIQIVAGEERCLEVGAALPAFSFQLWHNGQMAPVDLEQAQCCLSLVPTITEAGQVRLNVTPKVRHAGKGRSPWRPRSDRTGWMLNSEPSIEEYQSAGCTVTLQPGEYLVIGPRLDRPETLGWQTFVRGKEAVPVQRLLVLRAWKLDGQNPLEEETREGPVPLALQASRPRVRGVEP